MEVSHTSRRVGEAAPLLKRGDNVNENGRTQIVRWVRVDEEPVSYARAAVVTAPDYGALAA